MTIQRSQTSALPLLILLALPVSAQTARPAAPPAPARPARPPQAAVDPLTQDAIKKVESGDVAGAIRELEAQRGAKTASPQGLALLGTLYLQQGKAQEALAVLKPLADAQNADPAVLYNAARAALALKQTEAGLGYLKRGAQAAPGSPAARDLGLLAMRQGRLVEGYSLLYPWAAAHPMDTEARLAAASLAVQLERPQEAEEFLSAGGVPKDDPAIRLLRGRILTQKGDGAGAVTLLEALGKNHPPAMDLEIRRALAEAYLVANRPADAVKQLEGRAGQHPGLALLLGRAQRKAGNKAAALATLKPFADKLPADAASVGDPRPVLGIALEAGTLLTETGRAAEAVPVLEKATKLYPQSPPAWEALAKALEAVGRKDDAAKARTRMDEIFRTSEASGAPEVSANLQEAGIAMAAGQAEQALTAVRRELAASPGNLRARSLETRLLLTLDRKEEALRILQEALQKNPDNPELLYLRGAVQMAFYNWEPAEKDLRRTLQLAPQHTAAMNELAVLLMTRNEKGEAQALLEKILQINPQDQVARASLQTIKAAPAPPPQKP
ncbi:MAG TPA: tetratricopeptide repeat protein [Thermoanaerobaculia bacterium]|nr:tetratricopeptide repeat protein [Thermoanaerobaculia bacterium]